MQRAPASTCALVQIAFPGQLSNFEHCPRLSYGTTFEAREHSIGRTLDLQSQQTARSYIQLDFNLAAVLSLLNELAQLHRDINKSRVLRFFTSAIDGNV